MKLRARLLAAFAVVLAVSAGIALLVVRIPTRDRFLALGITIVIGLVIAFAVAEMFARPLGDLSDTASRVARVDLTARLEKLECRKDFAFGFDIALPRNPPIANTVKGVARVGARCDVAEDRLCEIVDGASALRS